MDLIMYILCQECVSGESILAGAQDLASVTQVECCALHLMCVLGLSDRRLAMLRRQGGENLVDIHTDCIQL